jgi:hypothetical protein
MRWVSGTMVRRDVERIFAYRQKALPALLGAATVSAVERNASR